MEHDTQTSIEDQAWLTIDCPVTNASQKTTITGGEISNTLDPKFDVFQNLREDFESGRFPWVGPLNDFLLGYVTLASTLHAFTDGVSKPIGSFVIGESSTGKTQFLDALCALMPEGRVENLTTASSKALIYKCRDNPDYLNGKVVFVEELSGLKSQEIQYLLRVLVTKGFARHTTVLSGKSETIDIRGAISLQSTGLSSDGLRDDTMNRLVIFDSDSTEDQTKAVIENIKSRYTETSLVVKDAFDDYRAFFEGLKSYPVIVPYVDKIEFDAKDAIARRFSKIFLDLLTTVTLLNQARREISEDGFLIAEEEDFEILKALTSRPPKKLDVVLSPSQKAVHEAIIELSGTGKSFTYKDIELAKPCDPEGKPYGLSGIKKAVGRLADLGMVEMLTSGRPVVWQLCAQEHSNKFFLHNRS